MHPFNGQQCQQYIITSVSSNIQSLPLTLPLALPSTTSIRKIPLALTKNYPTINSNLLQSTIASNTTNSIINSNLINSSIQANTNTNSNSKSITNYLVPMFLTANNDNNSNSLISSKPTIANLDVHQQPQHLITKNIPIMSSSKQAVMNNTNNITYQVIASASSASNLNTIIPATNGSMSLLLTSSSSINSTGHTSTGQIIHIRNAGISMKQQQQPQQLKQYQLQSQNVADLVKQVIIGKGKASNGAPVLPRTTLLKRLVPIKPAANHPSNRSDRTKIFKTTKVIPATYQRPAKLHTASTTSYENTNQKILIKPNVDVVNATSAGPDHDVKNPLISPVSLIPPAHLSTPMTPTKQLATLPSSTKTLSPSKEANSSSSLSNLVNLLQNNTTAKKAKYSLLKNAELKKVNNGAMKPIIKITTEHGNSLPDNRNISLAQQLDQQLKDNHNDVEILNQQPTNDDEDDSDLKMITIEPTATTTTTMTTTNEFALMEKPLSASLFKSKIRSQHRSLSLNALGRTQNHCVDVKSNSSNHRRSSEPIVKQDDPLPRNTPKETELINNENVQEDDTKFIEIVSKENEENLEKMDCDTVVELFDDVAEDYLENANYEQTDNKADEISKELVAKDMNENCLQNADNQEPAEMKANNTEGDSDDDVTILPIEEVQIESIEIVDDDDDDDDNNSNIKITNDNNNNNNNKNENNGPKNIQDQAEKINCAENLEPNVCSDKTSAYAEHIKRNMKSKAERSSQDSPLLKKTLTESKSSKMEAVSYHSVLDILSHFNMMHWRERIGSAKGTKIRFQLNEFNLVQIYEDCPPRNLASADYDKPLYERICTPKNPDDTNPTQLYQCRRCQCQGPAVDFLAPEFCSLKCLKRDARKRLRDEKACILRKHSRKTEPMLIRSESSTTPLVRKFRWAVYMKTCPNAIAAPITLFLNPFPTGPNNFIVGMKLEAIDPDNCSLFCVCTIVGISGYRLKLHFDGYDDTYDFWVNADSMDIFPHGWCAKTGRILQPPKDMSASNFNWPTYLHNQHAIAAPHHLFTHLKSISCTAKNPFKIGMHLEAEDLNDTGKLCVATVADVLDDRIRIHFDGWDDCYDIIVDIHSPYIHPCGWHAGRHQLVVPPECENSSFHWNDYIRKRNYGTAARAEFFSPREPINFRPNMKLEVVDPRNPSLIRPATVVAHKGHRVKLHLDCWPSDYCFWLEDDSPDLHPIGWCDTTDHHLEPPPGHLISTTKTPCPINGCRGVGNAKDPTMRTHSNRNCCPYAPENWRVIIDKPIRLSNDKIIRHKPKITLWKSSPLRYNNRYNEQPIFSLGLKVEKGSSNKEVNTSSSSAAAENLFNKKSFIEINSNSNLCDQIRISKEFLIDYGPRLQQNYTLWHKNFTLDGDKIHRNPMHWTPKETAAFVKDMLKCDDIMASAFLEEDIDGRAFLLLQPDDLTERLGFKLGKAVKLHTMVLQLRTIAVVKFKTPYSRNFIK